MRIDPPRHFAFRYRGSETRHVRRRQRVDRHHAVEAMTRRTSRRTLGPRFVVAVLGSMSTSLDDLGEDVGNNVKDARRLHGDDHDEQAKGHEESGHQA